MPRSPRSYHVRPRNDGRKTLYPPPSSDGRCDRWACRRRPASNARNPRVCIPTSRTKTSSRPSPTLRGGPKKLTCPSRGDEFHVPDRHESLARVDRAARTGGLDLGALVDCGDPRAIDSVIMDHARSHGFIVFTHHLRSRNDSRAHESSRTECVSSTSTGHRAGSPRCTRRGDHSPACAGSGFRRAGDAGRVRRARADFSASVIALWPRAGSEQAMISRRAFPGGKTHQDRAHRSMSVQVDRNRCSRSPESVFTLTRIGVHVAWVFTMGR